MFPRKQRKSHKNNNNNNNNKCVHLKVDSFNWPLEWSPWKRIDIKRVIISSKEAIQRSKCWWPPPPPSWRPSGPKSMLPLSLQLLRPICHLIILILFIVNLVQSAHQPVLSSSGSTPRPSLSLLERRHPTHSKPIGTSRMNWNSTRNFKQIQLSKTRLVSHPLASKKIKQPHQDGHGKPSKITDRLTFRDAQSGNNQSPPAWSQLAGQTNGPPTSQWMPVTRQQVQNASVVTGQPTQSRQVSPVLRQIPPEASSTNRANNQQRNNRQQHHHHHQHLLQPAESYNTHHIRHIQHRRPRFNDEPMVTASSTASRLYRRVLLCDKTLVSLDYLLTSKAANYRWRRRRPSEAGGHLSSPLISGEFELADFADDFEENSIELGAKYDSTHLLMVGSRNEPLVQPNTTAASNVSVKEIDRMAQMDSFAYHQHHQPLPAHLLLNDADPLVRCDMWDLEKGLKNRAPPEFLVRQAIKANFETVREAINRCRQLSERTYVPPGGLAVMSDDYYRDHALEVMSTEDLLSLFSMKRGLMPGTKWCGLGDQAASYNDLGPKYRIDICCRAHDHCPIRSKPFRNDYGILNIGLYTKSHCDCDADFYRCLREVRSRTADLLGNLYFNVMKLQCMREEKMKVCREMKPISLLGIERCSKFEESPFKTVFKFTTPPVAY